jgi:uncharacterized protein (TIGR03067 family)
MTRLFSVCAGVVLLGLSARADDGAGDEAGQPNGKWLAVKGTRDGKPLAKKELAKFKIILGAKGGRTGWNDPFMGTSDPFHNLAIGLELTTSPRRLYVIRQIGLKATTYPGIFKLDGDRLIVCWNLEPWTSPDGPAMRPMPKDFAAPKGSGLTLLVFEKAKDE